MRAQYTEADMLFQWRGVLWIGLVSLESKSRLSHHTSLEETVAVLLHGV